MHQAERPQVVPYRGSAGDRRSPRQARRQKKSQRGPAKPDGFVGRGGARERAQVSPPGGTGAQRTLLRRCRGELCSPAKFVKPEVPSGTTTGRSLQGFGGRPQVAPTPPGTTLHCVGASCARPQSLLNRKYLAERPQVVPYRGSAGDRRSPRQARRQKKSQRGPAKPDGFVGRGGARERAQVSPPGGTGAQRTLLRRCRGELCSPAKFVKPEVPSGTTTGRSLQGSGGRPQVVPFSPVDFNGISYRYNIVCVFLCPLMLLLATYTI